MFQRFNSYRGKGRGTRGEVSRLSNSPDQTLINELFGATVVKSEEVENSEEDYYDENDMTLYEDDYEDNDMAAYDSDDVFALDEMMASS